MHVFVAPHVGVTQKHNNGLGLGSLHLLSPQSRSVGLLPLISITRPHPLISVLPRDRRPLLSPVKLRLFRSHPVTCSLGRRGVASCSPTSGQMPFRLVTTPWLTTQRTECIVAHHLSPALCSKDHLMIPSTSVVISYRPLFRLSASTPC